MNENLTKKENILIKNNYLFLKINEYYNYENYIAPRLFFKEMGNNIEAFETGGSGPIKDLRFRINGEIKKISFCVNRSKIKFIVYTEIIFKEI